MTTSAISITRAELAFSGRRAARKAAPAAIDRGASASVNYCSRMHVRSDKQPVRVQDAAAPVGLARPQDVTAGPHSPEALLYLQRTAGNRAVDLLVAQPEAQPRPPHRPRPRVAVQR